MARCELYCKSYPTVWQQEYLIVLQYSPERAKPLAFSSRAVAGSGYAGNLLPSPKPWLVMRLASQGRGVYLTSFILSAKGFDIFQPARSGNVELT